MQTLQNSQGKPPAHSSSVFKAPGMIPLLALVALGFSGFSLLLPTSPTWAISGGATPAVAGSVTTVLMAVTIATQFLVNKLLERFGWGPVVFAGMLFLGLPAALQAISPHIALVLATSALRGIGFGILTVCASMAITILVPIHQRGRAVGAYGLAIAVPQFLFSSISPTLIEVLGMRWVLVIGVLPVVACLWVLPLGRRITELSARLQKESETNSNAASLPAVMGMVWASLLALILVTSAGGALLTFANQIAQSPALATGALLCLTGLAAPARWVMGSLSDRMDTRVLTVILGFTSAAGMALMGFSLLESNWSAAALLVGASILGIAYGGLQSTTMVQAFADAGQNNTTKASVLWNSTFDLGTGAGAMLVGILAQGAGFSMALVVVALVAIVGTIVAGAKQFSKKPLSVD